MSKIQLISAESEEDFKAAFVCVTNGLDGYFESVDDLAKALRGCGRNPSQRNIDTYWRAHKSKIILQSLKLYQLSTYVVFKRLD